MATRPRVTEKSAEAMPADQVWPVRNSVVMVVRAACSWMIVQPMASAEARVIVFRRMTRSSAGPVGGSEDAGMGGVSQPSRRRPARRERRLVLAYLRNF